MGHRTVKRVPLDFDAPLNKTWQGYISPDWRPCPSGDCDNGCTVAMAWTEKIVWQLLILASADEANGKALHPWLETVPCRPEKLPKPEAIRALTAGLSREYSEPFGHDACDRWSAAKAVVRAAGLDPDVWGTCQTCNGHALHPDDIAPSEAWEGVEPPEGDGWQLWETTSEGSPQTPVFATAAELADYCAEHCTVFADMRWTAAQWLASFEAGTTDVETTSEGSPQTPVFATAAELADYCAEHCTVFADMRWTAAQWLASFEAGTTDVDSLLVVRGPDTAEVDVTPAPPPTDDA